jgi:hypothetical protein
VLRAPTFPPTELDNLKREATTALDASRTDPRQIAQRALRRNNNPYPNGDPRYAPTLDEEIAAVRAVTPDGFQDGPSFTPDGSSLVYTRDPSPSADGLWMIHVDGTGLRQLTANPFIHDGECGCDGGAKVSPNGKTVAFVRVKKDNVTHALYSIGSPR